MHRLPIAATFAALAMLAAVPSRALGQNLGYAFGYQGRLLQAGQPVTGTFNLSFGLYAAATGGTPLSTLNLPAVSVGNGLFSVELDFGPEAFEGSARWLEVTVNGTPLSPRQPVRAAPYALALPGMRILPGLDSPNVLGGHPANHLLFSDLVGGTIAGGGNPAAPNQIRGPYGSIGGGVANQAAQSASVAGGVTNHATGYASAIAGGSGNTASGSYSAVPGGELNDAAGLYSIAAGRRAKAGFNGSFVWADSVDADFFAGGPNGFNVRCTGGARFMTNAALTSGVFLAGGGNAWSSVSDRNCKHHVQDIDTRDLLERLASIPITTWSYKSQDNSIRHIGPMAQDFHAAFGVGENDTTIATIDADGVALAAIQGLHKLLGDKDAQIAAMRDEQSRQADRIEALERQLRQLLKQNQPGQR